MASVFVGRHHDGGDGVGFKTWLGADFQAPGGNRAAHAFAEAGMAGVDIVQAFLKQQANRLA